MRISSLQFFSPKGMRPVRVIIYGTHTNDWMKALGSDSPVWDGLIPGRELIVENVPDGPIPPAEKKGMTTLVLPLMEDHTASCPVGYVGLLPSKKALETLRDKAAFARYAAMNRLSHRCPTVYPNRAVLHFPCVVKRTNLNAGVGIEYADNDERLNDVLQAPIFRDAQYLLQAYVPGASEYVTHCVCSRGRILWHCSYVYELPCGQKFRIAGSASVKAKITPAQLSELAAFLAPLSYSGPCNIDHKLTADGHVVVFEINPRLGGSLMYPENVRDLRAALSYLIGTALRIHRPGKPAKESNYSPTDFFDTDFGA